jgi:toxin FitB
MKFLVDANLLCEPTKQQCNQKAVDWLRENVVECVTDAVVMGEIWRGIDRLDAGRRKANLEEWFSGLKSRVDCLDWTREVAVVWGGLINEIQRSGFTVGIRDTMIAASAKHHGLTVATRNVDDFRRCGVPVINPFE